MTPSHPPTPRAARGEGGVAAVVRQVWAIVTKDLRTELRTREALSAMGLFAVLSLLTFSFALDLRGALARAAAPGVLWVTVALAGTSG
jgi:heme exporter protein B